MVLLSVEVCMQHFVGFTAPFASPEVVTYCSALLPAPKFPWVSGPALTLALLTLMGRRGHRHWVVGYACQMQRWFVL